MKFTPSTEQDVPQLQEWIQHDAYHKDCLNPSWWFTGQGLLSYCIQDDKGPTMYVRIDKENDLMRLHTQFAPDSEVSKRRVIKSLVWAVPLMEHLGKQENLKGFIFKSTSPLLIDFMRRKFGFQPVGNDDYVLKFGV